MTCLQAMCEAKQSTANKLFAQFMIHHLLFIDLLIATSAAREEPPADLQTLCTKKVLLEICTAFSRAASADCQVVSI